MIYMHVLRQGGNGMKSPLDCLWGGAGTRAGGSGNRPTQ
jgi:hypothetical protein